jgi:hypothetical protein
MRNNLFDEVSEDCAVYGPLKHTRYSEQLSLRLIPYTTPSVHACDKVNTSTLISTRTGHSSQTLHIILHQRKSCHFSQRLDMEQFQQSPVQPRFLPSPGKMVIDTRLAGAEILRA